MTKNRNQYPPYTVEPREDGLWDVIDRRIRYGQHNRILEEGLILRVAKTFAENLNRKYMERVVEHALEMGV